MNNRYITRTATVLLLACCLPSSTAKASGPPTSNVNVVNTPNVNVVNTPTITLSGTPDVNIANTPTVSVSNFPSSQTVSGSVQVGNGTAHPVPVRDIDNPVRHPFQAQASAAFAISDDSTSVIITTVPLGKRLVIEHVSEWVSLNAGQKVSLAEIETIYINDCVFPITMTPQGTDFVSGHDNFVGSEQVQFYGESGTSVIGFAHRSGTGAGASATFVISGYIVDVL